MGGEVGVRYIIRQTSEEEIYVQVKSTLSPKCNRTDLSNKAFDYIGRGLLLYSSA